MTKYAAYVIAAMIIAWGLADGLRASFPDALVYYNAGNGVFLGKEIPQSNGVKVWLGWLYPDPTAIKWEWAKSVNFRFFISVIFVVNSAAFLFLVTLLIRETKHYAWIILLAFSKPLAWYIAGGNEQVALLTIVLNPVTTALAVCDKPYYGIILLVHIYAAYRAMGSNREVSGGVNGSVATASSWHGSTVEISERRAKARRYHLLRFARDIS
jgi:hypothetical protein